MADPMHMRRSFVRRRLLAAGVPRNDSEIPLQRTPEHAPLTLVDLSHLPRWGIKGRDAFAWLKARQARVPERNNAAERQPDGTLIARLSPGEALILGPRRDGGCFLDGALAGIAGEGDGACYPVPRRDSHSLFFVKGSPAARMFAKLCAIDLAPDRFADGSIAQTSVARLSAIIIRDDVNSQLGFSVLVESASAEYFWDCLLDAMGEFGAAIADASSIREMQS